MGTAAALIHHALTAGQALSGTSATPMASATPQASGTGSSDDTSSGSATISANDFLTLLVTEMQNQDPTADTDPNEYINQLVQVNSLEQLIDINQTLSGDVSGTSSSSGSGSSGKVVFAPQNASAASPVTATTAAHRSGATPGNLGVPGANAAAQKVGHALDGQPHLKPPKGSAIALQ